MRLHLTFTDYGHSDEGRLTIFTDVWRIECTSGLGVAEFLRVQLRRSTDVHVFPLDKVADFNLTVRED